jgi:glycosyltransferase involved in cell wall biosynthesis
MLCGTPLISTNFGAFAETIEHGVTGFRCNTLGDFVKAIEKAGTLDRTKVLFWCPVL